MHIYAIILQRRNALICSFIKCALIFRALKDPKLYDALRLEIAISSLSKFFFVKTQYNKKNLVRQELERLCNLLVPILLLNFVKYFILERLLTFN